MVKFLTAFSNLDCSLCEESTIVLGSTFIRWKCQSSGNFRITSSAAYTIS